jgi:hypothetical protein
VLGGYGAIFFCISSDFLFSVLRCFWNMVVYIADFLFVISLFSPKAKYHKVSESITKVSSFLQLFSGNNESII